MGRLARLNWPLGISMYMQHAPILKIAQALGCTRATVREHARKHNWADLMAKSASATNPGLSSDSVDKAEAPLTTDQLAEDCRQAIIHEARQMLCRLPKSHTQRARVMQLLAATLRTLAGPQNTQSTGKKVVDKVDLDMLRE